MLSNNINSKGCRESLLFTDPIQKYYQTSALYQIIRYHIAISKEYKPSYCQSVFMKYLVFADLTDNRSIIIFSYNNILELF